MLITGGQVIMRAGDVVKRDPAPDRRIIDALPGNAEVPGVAQRKRPVVGHVGMGTEEHAVMGSGRNITVVAPGPGSHAGATEDLP